MSRYRPDGLLDVMHVRHGFCVWWLTGPVQGSTDKVTTTPDVTECTATRRVKAYMSIESYNFLKTLARLLDTNLFMHWKTGEQYTTVQLIAHVSHGTSICLPRFVHL